MTETNFEEKKELKPEKVSHYYGYRGTLSTDKKELMNIMIDALINFYDEIPNMFHEHYKALKKEYEISEKEAAVEMLENTFDAWCRQNSKLNYLADADFIWDLGRKLRETLILKK